MSWGLRAPSTIFIMIYTVYLILFLVAVVAVTYPEEFPTLARNPKLLVEAIALESKRRWMILKFGTILYIEKKKLEFSLWQARDIIAEERRKQLEQNTND